MKNAYQKLNKKLVAAGLAVGAGAANANAALTSADVDMSGAQSDITTVFIAMLGVGVLIFGYRKISGIIRLCRSWA